MSKWSEQVGARSEAVRNVVEAGAVRRFAEAIGDPNPLYRDERAASASRWGRRIAPPTFPRTFDYGQIPDIPLPAAGVIHGEQSFTYLRPIFVGDELICRSRLIESYEKEGRDGRLHFLVFERSADDPQGNRVVTLRDVLILTAAVLRAEAP